MALTAQIQSLTRKLQDFYDKLGKQLTNPNQAFTDDELDDLINQAFLEVTEGARTAELGNGEDQSLAFMVAKADGILMLAQDEAKRKRWEFNQNIIDDTGYPKRLIDIARELRMRYEKHQDRKLQKILENKQVVATGGLFTINSTTPLHQDRKFDNKDVKRNKPKR